MRWTWLSWCRPDARPDSRGLFPGPPDLAVEVLSPHDRASEVLAKVSDWLETGCLVVWVVDPENRSVTVYGRQKETRAVHLPGVLSGEEVLPGLQVGLSKVFPA